MRIYQIAHAGFDIGEYSKKITDMIFKKIRSISINIKGSDYYTPFESEFKLLNRPIDYSVFVDNEDLQGIQECFNTVPFLSKRDEKSKEKDKYDKMLYDRKSQRLKIVLQFRDKYDQLESGDIFFPGFFRSNPSKLEIDIIILPNVINDNLHLALTNTVEHELQHYAQYISNVPWRGDGFSASKDGYGKYVNHLEELQAFISGISAQLSELAIGYISFDDMRKMESEEEALAYINNKTSYFPSLIVTHAKSLRISPKNFKDFVKSILRMINQKIKFSVHKLFIASRENNINDLEDDWEDDHENT